MTDELKRVFRPEFINRVDGIVVFRALSKAEISQIVDLEVDKVARRLEEHRLKLSLTPAARDPGPVAALEQRDRVMLLREAMAALPDTLRTAVLMRDIQELSYQEIADKLRLPEGTVKSRINRGRTELARQIRKLRADDFGPSPAVLKRTGAS